MDDFDEISLPGHAAVVLAPVALALAEHLHLSGKELLRAYCLGLELDFKLAKQTVNELIGAGWCDFSVLGTVSAAAVAALLLGLEDEAFSNALAIGVSKASGVMANFGTSTKPYHVGMAASGGIEAALLAKHGVTGNPAAFEGETGFFHAFTGRELPADRFDWSRWDVLEDCMQFKLHPCCTGALPTIDVFGRMVREHRLTREMVRSIDVALDPYAFACMAYRQPKTMLEAKFSIAFPVAKLLEGELRLFDWREEEVLRPELQEFYPKVSLHIPEEWKSQYVHKNIPCVVTVTLEDGRVLREEGERYYYTRRSWDYLISEEELLQKFCDCVAHRIPDDRARAWFSALSRAESATDAAELLRPLTVGG